MVNKIILSLLVAILVSSSGCEEYESREEPVKSSSLLPVVLNGKVGYINESGKIEIMPQFDVASKFSEGLGRILEGTKYGYIDTSGNIVIEPQFDGASDFSDGMALIVKDGKRGFIDRTGKIVIKPQFDNVWGFSEGLATVNIAGKSISSLRFLIIFSQLCLMASKAPGCPNRAFSAPPHQF